MLFPCVKNSLLAKQSHFWLWEAAFIALTLLAGRQLLLWTFYDFSTGHFIKRKLTFFEIRYSIRPVKIEWWGVGVVICPERGADCLHMVQLMPLYPQTPSSLASYKSRLVLPFWYWLTQAVLEKRPLNGCGFGYEKLSNGNWEYRKWLFGVSKVQWLQVRYTKAKLVTSNIFSILCRASAFL